MMRKIIPLFILLILSLASLPTLAEMEAIGDAELASITGQAGISLWMSDFGASLQADSFRITDPDTGNSFEFNNIVYDDGAGGPAHFSSLVDFLTIDAGTLNDPMSPLDGTTILAVEDPDWSQTLYLSVGNLVFCNTDLGSLNVDDISLPSFHLYLTGHGEGISAEFGFEYGTADVRYTYNNSLATLSASGIHFAGNATENPSDDPSDPSTWEFFDLFRIGDLVANQLATMDIGTGNGQSLVNLRLPAGGCIRIESVNFGGVDLGPCAIDGIAVLNLQLQMPAIVQ